jgi:hypothetical protein
MHHEKGKGGISKIYLVDLSSGKRVFVYFSDVELEGMLKEAVADDDFIYAAEIRDEIAHRKTQPTGLSAELKLFSVNKENKISDNEIESHGLEQEWSGTFMIIGAYKDCPVCGAVNCSNNDSCIICDHPF